MIELSCQCGQSASVPESEAGKKVACSGCGQAVLLACGEELPEGAGEGDFDAQLTIQGGPDVGMKRILMGGVAEIKIGKLATAQIQLVAAHVSRNHAKLVRVDFGPSRWKLVDTQSSNGTFVNGQRITEVELKAGDSIRIGEYLLSYAMVQPEAEVVELPAAAPAMPTASIAPAAPPVPVPRPAKGHAFPKQNRLSYETNTSEEGPRLLGDCDISWVMKLRNASTLMVYTLVADSIARRLIFFPYLPNIAYIVSGLMAVAAAWLLTSPEPDARSTSLPTRWLLRICASAAFVGTVCMQLGDMTENPGLEMAGGGLMLAAIPQTVLFLWYLRKLAVRLPNPGLAFGAVFVMIGLPVFMIMIAVSMFESLRSNSGAGTLGTTILAALGLLIFRIIYICLLIWFNKSFS